MDIWRSSRILHCTSLLENSESATRRGRFKVAQFVKIFLQFERYLHRCQGMHFPTSSRFLTIYPTLGLRKLVSRDGSGYRTWISGIHYPTTGNLDLGSQNAQCFCFPGKVWHSLALWWCHCDQLDLPPNPALLSLHAIFLLSTSRLELLAC